MATIAAAAADDDNSLHAQKFCQKQPDLALASWPEPDLGTLREIIRICVRLKYERHRSACLRAARARARRRGRGQRSSERAVCRPAGRSSCATSEARRHTTRPFRKVCLVLATPRRRLFAGRSVALHRSALLRPAPLGLAARQSQLPSSARAPINQASRPQSTCSRNQIRQPNSRPLNLNWRAETLLAAGGWRRRDRDSSSRMAALERAPGEPPES